MTQTTQAADTKEPPHRRLNVVPARICKQCVQFKHDYGKPESCKAGDISTSPVTGDKTYVTLCKDKNTDGECVDYLAIDHKAIAEERADKNRREALLGLLMVFSIAAWVHLLLKAN